MRDCLAGRRERPAAGGGGCASGSLTSSPLEIHGDGGDPSAPTGDRDLYVDKIEHRQVILGG